MLFHMILNFIQKLRYVKHTHHNFEIASSESTSYISSVFVGSKCILVYLRTMELLSLHHVLETFFSYFPSSQEHLRTKVTPSFHLTYSKNEGGGLKWYYKK